MTDNKGFFSRWLAGVRKITPIQQLHAKLVGTVGAGVGIALAATVMTLRGSWEFLLLFAFVFALQVISFIGVYQQWCNAVEMDVVLKDQKGNLKKLMEANDDG